MKKNGRTFTFPNGVELPVIEASSSFIVTLIAEDAENGNPLDPYGCAIVCAVRRLASCNNAMVSKTVAYIEMVWKGERVAMKFSIPAATRRAIIHYDDTKEFPAEGFILAPIARVDTAENRRLRTAKSRKNNPKVSSKKEPARPRAHHEPVTFRNVTGRIHTRPS